MPSLLQKGPKPSTPAPTPLNVSQSSLSSSISKPDKKPLQRVVGSLRRALRSSKSSLVLQNGDERSLIEPVHVNGKSRKGVTPPHHCREQELEASVDDLRRELQEKEERMKLLVEENKAHLQDVLEMTERVEEGDDTIRRLKQEIDEERRSWEFASVENQGSRLADAMERIQELETQLQVSLGAAEARTGSITMVIEEREELSQHLRHELAKLADVVCAKDKELDSLTSSRTALEHTNQLLRERIERLDHISSQVQPALDQAYLRAERLKRELDLQVPLSCLILFFTILFVGISLGLGRLYEIGLALIPQPTKTYISH